VSAFADGAAASEHVGGFVNYTAVCCVCICLFDKKYKMG